MIGASLACDLLAFARAVDEDGCARGVLALAGGECDALVEALPFLGERPGRRDLLETEVGRRVTSHPLVRAHAESVLGTGAIATRVILFDKTPAANWRVPWHQDVAVALRERRDVPGFGPWRERDGLLQAVAPSAVLERILAVRIHLDDSDGAGGALRVLPGTHRRGRLTPQDAAAARASTAERHLGGPKGSLVAFRPLLLHSSSRGTSPAHRRVLHVEWASSDALPEGLAWRAPQGSPA